MLFGAGVFGYARALCADHHVISSDPLEVESDLSSSDGRYTPLEDFYVRNHYRDPGPAVSAVLSIEGLVERPRRLSLIDLESLSRRELGAVLECAGNPVGVHALASNGAWGGWALSDILALARPAQRASYLHLHGRDSYARSVDLNSAMSDAIVANSLNGRPLEKNHGTPWRALFPGSYGMNSVKWLERIVLSDEALPPAGKAYLEARKETDGRITFEPLPRLQVKSVILYPTEGSVVKRGGTQVRGLAWTGEGTITEVQVSSDIGGNWTRAVLERVPDNEWAPWEASIELEKPGAADLTCRATDSRGRTQPDMRDPARLDGYANNWCHRVRCIVI